MLEKQSKAESKIRIFEKANNLPQDFIELQVIRKCLCTAHKYIS